MFQWKEHLGGNEQVLCFFQETSAMSTPWLAMNVPENAH
jgi:hypothetical protein